MGRMLVVLLAASVVLALAAPASQKLALKTGIVPPDAPLPEGDSSTPPGMMEANIAILSTLPMEKVIVDPATIIVSSEEQSTVPSHNDTVTQELPSIHIQETPNKPSVIEVIAKKRAPEILIAVVTAPNHFRVREVIRETYMVDAIASGRCDVKFFVGQLNQNVENRAVMDEKISAELNMIRFHDFTESYHNLSSKALDIFAYASERGYQAVLKVDDDTYVRVNKLLQYWDDHNQDPDIYAGLFVDGGKAMVTDPSSKWYMQDQYPDRLEDYANGPGMLLGSTAFDFMRSQYSQLFRYRVDDAAIAIWLKDVPLNKVHMNVDNYSYWIHDDTVWINPINAQEMLDLHRGYHVTPQICQDTCLCYGDPQPNKAGCVTWEQFANAGYQDLVPRLANML